MINVFKKFLSRKSNESVINASSSSSSSGQNNINKHVRNKELIVSSDPKDRMIVAADPETDKEVLYYLAKHDPDSSVRKTVVNNSSFPPHVSEHVASDDSADVKIALAARLVELLPSLSEDEHSKIYGFVVNALGGLAVDQVILVRRALSTALKDCACAPPNVAGKLARDLEREVSEPVLRFCTALPDKDMLEILSGSNEAWIADAIAGREVISSKLSEAVIDSDIESAGAILMKNEGAIIDKSLLEKIIAKSKEHKEWQKPAAMMSSLSVPMAKELASFVGGAVKNILVERSDFEEGIIEEISEVFERRVGFMEDKIASSEEATSDRVARFYKDNKLDDQVVNDAIASRDFGFVFESLAILGKIDVVQVRKIVEMKAPRSLISIVWKSGLSMRTALNIQKELAHIPSSDIIYPRGGTDYPLSKDELEWQLDFLGI